MSEFGKQLKTLYNQCMDLPSQQRMEWVENSDFDQKIKDKVASMLKNQSQEYGMTAAMITEISNDLGVTALTADDVFNEYRLIKQIGQGGQGEVWLAESQGVGYEHKVAIKIIKPMHSQNELLRFQAERSILASLQHAHIAQFIDGGSLPDGRQYMVLEWINGQTFIEYIHSQQPTLKEKLQLFLKITHAVQFAHQNGVIHRDIKPSNVLVNDQGVVKLLDFGVAKQAQIDITETVKDQMLTMAYASPEQLLGQPASTATDVYALGLLLYEVVTDCPAQRQNGRALADMVTEITEKQPIKPSLANTELSSKINNDLDNLILKALKKSPGERYQTVAELSTDIENYLRNKPLIAAGDNAIYRFKKMIQRNPANSVFLFLLFCTLAVLLTMNWQHQHAMQVQINNALQAQQKAEQQSILAEKTKDFLLSTLKSASPLGTQGKSPTLEDVLATSEIQLTHGLEDQPSLKINLLNTLADIHINLGNYPKGLHFYDQSIELAGQHQLDDLQLSALGQKAVNLMWSDDPTLAEPALQEAQQFAQDHTISPEALSWHWARVATWQQENEQADKARATINQAFEFINKEQINNPHLIGRLYNELAASYRYGDSQKGLEAINKAIEYGHLALGENHPIIQERLTSKAVKLMRLNRHNEAEKTLEKSLEMAQKLYQETNPKMANLYSELGTFYHDQGLFSQAFEAYSKTLNITEKNLGKASVTYAITSNNLAYLYEDMGKLDEAETMFIESLEIRTNIMSHQPMRLASVKANLSRVWVKLGRFQQAQKLLNDVMPVYQENNRSNLYNEVTQTALTLSENCLAGMENYDSLLAQLNKESQKSWRLMHSRIWLGQKLRSCGYHQRANRSFKHAEAQSHIIYQKGSEGQKLMAQKIN